ncbi:unnamed protein product [Hydatigera taeniaeformis]|uniref:Ty3-gypsy retrotransposon protein n=1 Tax=Hydatigena taeniaeformis TaxID=6205 RepID=A0A0R3WKK8_HYDTA|nr:unnamed protein product [Hydatigera taeniaeformis]
MPTMTRKRICERGHSINGAVGEVDDINPKSAANKHVVGGKQFGEDELKAKSNHKTLLADVLKSDVSVDEMKKFQRNVIYALNRLMKEAEMEKEKSFQGKNELSV